MVDVDVKVPALGKLLDYAASGLGAIAGPMLAPWKARREAEAKRIASQAKADRQLREAKAQADSLRVTAQAQSEARQHFETSVESWHGTVEISSDGIRQRIEFQERKRQENIASIVNVAASNLDNKDVPDHEPDSDWIARFFDYAQDVSSEDMKTIWGKILSGEVETPGRTSLRTLSILRDISKRDAEIFSTLMEYRISDFIFEG